MRDAKMKSRREILTDGLGAAAGVFAPQLASATAAGPESGAVRKDRSIPFGSAVRASALRGDKAYQAAVAENCQWLVAEGEMKWQSVQARKGEYNFADADFIADFARSHRMELRGHTLVWYAALPDWLVAIKGRTEAEGQLASFIQTIVTHYRGVIRTWDVVNEPIADRPMPGRELRPSIWMREIGADYLATAFKVAHESDPAARLFINEYDIEGKEARAEARCSAFLRLIRILVDAGVPLHGVGLQGHLRGSLAIDRARLQSFLRAVDRMGLEVMITELDVIDHELPGDEGVRDRLVADRTYEFLDTVFEIVRPKAVLTWGISDKYTWVPMYFRRPDGRANRPLPLDSDMKPKPMLSVIDSFCR